MGPGRFQGISAVVDGLGVESGQFQEQRQGLCEIAMIIRDEDDGRRPRMSIDVQIRIEITTYRNKWRGSPGRDPSSGYTTFRAAIPDRLGIWALGVAFRRAT